MTTAVNNMSTGGASVETCTVTFVSGEFAMPSLGFETVVYLGSDGQACSDPPRDG